MTLGTGPVRFAVQADRDAVVAMMPAANLAAGFGPDGIAPLNPTAERMVLLFDQHLVHSDACLIVYAPDRARGFLMAVLFAHPFDSDVRIAKDTAWFIEEGCRGWMSIANGMLDLYEDWARVNRCAHAGMAGMGESPRVGSLYKRRRYVAAETHYLKKL